MDIKNPSLQDLPSPGDPSKAPEDPDMAEVVRLVLRPTDYTKWTEEDVRSALDVSDLPGVYAAVQSLVETD